MLSLLNLLTLRRITHDRDLLAGAHRCSTNCSRVPYGVLANAPAYVGLYANGTAIFLTLRSFRASRSTSMVPE